MYSLIDCDRHVMEPLSLWKELVSKKTLIEYPLNIKEVLVKDNDDFNQNSIFEYFLGDSPILKNWGADIQVAVANKKDDNKEQRLAAMSPETQLQSMDESNINIAYLFPTFASYIINHQDISSSASLEFARAYNTWLTEYCNYDSKRLRGVGAVSRHDPTSLKSQALDIAERGWTAIVIRPEVINGVSLGSAEYEEFWQVCESNNIAIAFHGGTHLHGPTSGSERYVSRFALHACSHPIEAQMAFLSLLESGVLHRYPKLKFAFLEAGSAWVPYWLWRLDNICYPEFPSLVAKNIKILPSEYFKRQCWVAIEPGEPNLRETVSIIGHEKLLFGSDFPHPDHAHIDTNELAESCAGLTPEELKDVLTKNPLDFFETPIRGEEV